MDEKSEMYYAFVKGNTGRWIFPVEAKPSFVKDMQDDGIEIYPLETNFVRTDAMKLYSIEVQGKNKTWTLSSPLEPKKAEGIQEAGITINEIVEKVVEEKVVEKKVVEKKTKSKGKASK